MGHHYGTNREPFGNNGLNPGSTQGMNHGFNEGDLSQGHNPGFNKTSNQGLNSGGYPQSPPQPSIPLNAGWDSIDPSSLEDIGFGRRQLSQLQNGELSPEIIQDSINAFAFDLKHNGMQDKIKSNPLNFFMGILRNNQPYAAPSNYQDPKMMAMKAYLEQKKVMRDEKKRMEEEMFQLAFEDWSDELDDAQCEAIIPEARYREYPMKEGFLKEHFRKEIWPSRQKGWASGAAE
jgi:hypothetical protein